MSERIVLSLMDGLFQGGSPIIHANTVAYLHQHSDQRHDVLSYTSRVQREHTVQKIRQSLPHAILTEAQVGLHWFTRTPSDDYSDMDLLFAEQLVRGSDVLFSLKEQPLTLLDRIGTFGRPLVAALHRSDPENQGGGTGVLGEFAKDGRLTAAICCAYSVQAAYHEATGMPLEMLPVIPNGIDLERFVPSQRRRERTRAGLGIPERAPVLFLSARYDSMKNIPLFVESAGRLLQEVPDAWFLMCGAGMTDGNGDLQNLLNRHVPEGLHHRFVRLGIRSAMENLYPAADLVVLTSTFGEAAPLSLLEGMACGLVPVTTPVGDSALIVGDERLVAEPTVESLAEHWQYALTHHPELRDALLARRADFDSVTCYRRYGEILERL
ncbi:MAG: glycosyltransferase [Microbacteriaceae bacterium]|jgi:glycosyltransferase involved in cell wall biosynthesis|nr:glycosyltransferase [Microbacteriaceae bacterium]MCI1207533.1 glycosyltransferase [Microbacteriaceae bacterium]